MKKLTLLCAFLCCIGHQAFAGDVYGRIDTGYSWSTDMGKDLSNTDAGGSAILGVGVGYQINDYLRTDVTLGYRGWYNASGDVAFNGSNIGLGADIDSTVGLVNAYYDVGHFGRFTPYIGGGLGFSSNHVDQTNINVNGVNAAQVSGNTNTAFAWQAGVGTSIDIMPHLAFDIGYRYVDMGTAETGTTETLANGTSVTVSAIKGGLYANEVQAGLRYTF